MTKKECKTIAKQIAKYEQIIQTTDNAAVKREAEQFVISITNKIDDFEDMLVIDEMVLKILNKEN